nr:hypothetical protein [Tanacetum cinerariifolium]GEY52196.1 hypothetical protein [Tanacetum cinerariifolium]
MTYIVHASASFPLEPDPNIEPSLLAASSAISSSDSGMASFACTWHPRSLLQSLRGFQEWICLVYALERPSEHILISKDVRVSNIGIIPLSLSKTNYSSTIPEDEAPLSAHMLNICGLAKKSSAASHKAVAKNSRNISMSKHNLAYMPRQKKPYLFDEREPSKAKVSSSHKGALQAISTKNYLGSRGNDQDDPIYNKDSESESAPSPLSLHTESAFRNDGSGFTKPKLDLDNLDLVIDEQQTRCKAHTCEECKCHSVPQGSESQ